MKVFTNLGKINFVDENNVFVGYDYIQDCCENFGYFFSKSNEINEEKLSKENLSEDNIESLVFDTSSYIFDLNYIKEFSIPFGERDCNLLQFKLVSKNNKNDDVYLTLYNYHNGYYYHGFEVKIGEEIIKEDAI